ncbi:MAG TPA: SpoIIE family protein phosphatase [Bacteroidota bacterium]|nr:SpoIIE family protein phosphatase [Bacteroidota bacterium]
MAAARKHKEVIEWGVATFTLSGQTESGDLHVVKNFKGGVLVGVIDGLGHGKEAAVAAKAAAEILENYSQESVIPLLRRVHDGLHTTRGVVMSIARINAVDNTMTWLSVGNVEGILLRHDRKTLPDKEIILLRGGVVGYNLPLPFASVHPLFSGDTLIFATDGIHNSFQEIISTQQSPQGLADKICAQYCKKTDDALVLVARYRGKQ